MIYFITAIEVGSRPRHSTMEGAGFALLGSFHAASVAAIQGGRSV